MSIFRKVFSLLLCIVLACGLLPGCGNQADTDSSSPTDAAGETLHDAPALEGALVVNAGAAFLLSYDKSGHVLEVIAYDDDADIILHNGEIDVHTTCAETAVALIQSCIGLGVLSEENNDVILRLQKDAKLPTEDFLQMLSQQIADAADVAGVETNVTVISTEDLTATGDISLIQAKELLLNYLNITEYDFLDATETPVDGAYGFQITVDGWTDYYLVDSVTCAVYMGIPDGAFMEEDEVIIEDIEETVAEKTEETTEESTEAGA